MNAPSGAVRFFIDQSIENLAARYLYRWFSSFTPAAAADTKASAN
jgi:hypothetical protein